MSLSDQYELVPIGQLNPYYRNARRGNVDLIVESLRELGQFKPLLVNRGSMTGRPREVLTGNHTLQAGQAAGMSQLEVRWTDVDEATAARIVLIDNRASDLSTYDNNVLEELLGSLPDLTATGYSDFDLQSLVRGNVTALGFGDNPDDVVPRVPKEPITRDGDVWQLGRHRLMCGNSRMIDDVERLMDGDVADVMWTDPPYGVEQVGGDTMRKTRAQRKADGGQDIAGDNLDDLPGLLTDAFTSAMMVLRPGAPVYVAHPAGPDGIRFHEALRDTGYEVRQYLIWVKERIAPGRSDYHYKHEPILYAFKPGDADTGRLGRGSKHWHGDHTASTVFTIPRPARSDDHPTMKPVELVRAMLRNSLGQGEIVLDLFGGSGTTLLAAEMNRGTARLMELSPGYCDVIVRRYEMLTGVTAHRVNA